MDISPNPTAAAVSEPGGKTIKLKVIDIGPWNMDATSFVTIVHGINNLKVIDVRVMIRRDDGVSVYPIRHASDSNVIE